MMMFAILQSPRRRALAIVALLVLAWNLCAWVLVQRYYVSRTDVLIEDEERFAQVRVRDLAGSIRKNLHYMSGVPEVMAHAREVTEALRRLAGDPSLSGGTRRERVERWKADAALRNLSGYLGLVQASLDIDVLYVADMHGEVFAASDRNRAGLSIGTSLADRDYFKAAVQGRRSVQYAIGKSTGIPGLFFCSPVLIEGRVAGVVAAKIHMPNLSFLLDQSDAFLTDANGVIIMARNRSFEMQALPAAPIGAVAAPAKDALYHRQTFAPLSIAPWRYGGDRAPVLLAGSSVPSVIVAQALPEFGIEVHVNSPVAAIPAVRVDQLRVLVLLGVSGSLLIGLGAAAIAYLRAAARSKARLWKKAHFDTLTGLPNRDLFRQRLAEAVRQARQSGTPMALLLCDMDGFKEINDTLGHDAGDQVLKEAARRIDECVRRSDTVARLGGDEFTVVLPDLRQARRALAIAQNIVDCLGAPFALPGQAARLSVSLGVAFFPEDAGDVDALLKNADLAMYAAKQQGGNRFARRAADAPAPLVATPAPDAPAHTARQRATIGP